MKKDKKVPEKSSISKVGGSFFEVRVQSFTHNSYLRISMGALKSAIFCEQTFAEKSSVSTRVVYSFVLQSHHKDSHHL